MICLWKGTGSDLLACSGGGLLRCAPKAWGLPGASCVTVVHSVFGHTPSQHRACAFVELIARPLPAKIRREDVLDACSACFAQAMLLAVCKKLRRAQAERDELIDAAQPTATRSRRARAF